MVTLQEQRPVLGSGKGERLPGEEHRGPDCHHHDNDDDDDDGGDGHGDDDQDYDQDHEEDMMVMRRLVNLCRRGV